MPLDLEAVQRAVAGSRESLGESGFAMDLAERDGGLVVTVRALPDACEECLVPKPVFQAILARELADAGLSVPPIAVTYPVEVPE